MEGFTTQSPDLPAVARVCVARAAQRTEPAGSMPIPGREASTPEGGGSPGPLGGVRFWKLI